MFTADCCRIRCIWGCYFNSIANCWRNRVKKIVMVTSIMLHCILYNLVFLLFLDDILAINKIYGIPSQGKTFTSQSINTVKQCMQTNHLWFTSSRSVTILWQLISVSKNSFYVVPQVWQMVNVLFLFKRFHANLLDIIAFISRKKYSTLIFIEDHDKQVTLYMYL